MTYNYTSFKLCVYNNLNMPKKILIVDNHDDLRTILTKEFMKNNHLVSGVDNRSDALKLLENEGFDVIVADLNGESLISDLSNTGMFPNSASDSFRSVKSNVKTFKVSIGNFFKSDFNEEELKYFVETILNCKSKHIDRSGNINERHEMIEIEVPGVISLIHCILDYLMKRVKKLGIVNPEESNLFVALDEAFVNAIKHGNKFDTSKSIKITVDITTKEARFTIEDEGDGFDINSIPNPTDTENLFKTSGRGVMFMYNIMDEVKYNARGNRLTLVKKSDSKR